MKADIFFLLFFFKESFEDSSKHIPNYVLVLSLTNTEREKTRINAAFSALYWRSPTNALYLLMVMMLRALKVWPLRAHFTDSVMTALMTSRIASTRYSLTRTHNHMRT